MTYGLKSFGFDLLEDMSYTYGVHRENSTYSKGVRVDMLSVASVEINTAPASLKLQVRDPVK